MKPLERSALMLAIPLAALSLAAIASAQEAVGTEPVTALTAPILRKSEPGNKSRPAEPAGAFFQFGPFRIHPHLTARFVYGLGLPTEGGRHVASMIYTDSPGLQIDAGQHWTIDYTPTWTTYTARALHDTLEHSVRAQGAGMVQEWAVQVSENYTASNPILFETGRQTPQRTWATQLGASRSLGTDVSFQTLAALNERYGETFPDTRDWTTMNWLTVRLPYQLETGLGLGAGYTDIVGRPDAKTKRYMGRLNWHPTDKLNLGIDGGVETRLSRAVGSKKMNSPILNATLGYQPFQVTKLVFTGSRSVASSYFDRQVTTSSSRSFSLEQRLLKHFYLSATYNHQRTGFESVTADIPVTPPDVPSADPTADPPGVSLPGRSDRTESISLRLSTQLFQRWSLAASYQRNANSSSQSGFTFISTQFGFDLSCKY